MGFVLSQADRFAVRANLRQVPIPDSVGFSVQRRPPVVEQNAAFGQIMIKYLERDDSKGASRIYIMGSVL